MSNGGKEVTKFPLNEIEPNSFFSENAYLPDKRFVVAVPETPFSPDLIKALNDWGFTEVFCAGSILDENDESLIEYTLINDNEMIKKAQKFYSSFERYTEDLFLHIAVENKLDTNGLAKYIKAACETIREDQRYLLRIEKTSFSHNYLTSHAVKSTIISIIIGFHLKLPVHRLIELGVAALLHEAGMIKLPRQIYLSDKPLEPHEQKAILAHPIMGFNMLKSFGLPLTIILPALEHHERENGHGYPQKITGDKISLYSKIIAVACSYEAISSQRPHKEAKDEYTGMVELLKNEGKQYDDSIIRALVFSLSIYPIGIYVLLSNNKKGQVVDVNRENPQYPIVQVFGKQAPEGINRVIETSKEGVFIIRTLRRDEIGTNPSPPN